MVNIDLNGYKTEVKNFWNAIHFHPTDAIEDEWGKRILNSISEDGAANFIRIYAMFEDIVSKDDDGKLIYDFKLNDERIDYLNEKGFKLLICFNFMPNCIAKNPDANAGLPRYKGKTVNNSVPEDYALWEEICFEYVKHLKYRYGKRVESWRFHCWNEPDHEYWVTSKTCFDYERDNDRDKIEEYIKLYDAFSRGVKRACKEAKIGGPSAAYCDGFMRGFAEHIAKHPEIELNFLSIHTYSDIKYTGTTGKISPENIVKRVLFMQEMLNEYGLINKEIIIDEWGAAAGGFLNIKKHPEMIFRENEYYPAFYFKLIKLIHECGADVSHMLICLSGQHKSVSDFDGYRSFFTKSGFKKPIYNGYCLASRLGEFWLDIKDENCIATVNKSGDAIIALYNLEDKEKRIKIKVSGLNGEYEVCHTRIDKEHANSYGKWKDIGEPELDKEMIDTVASAGELKTTTEAVCGEVYAAEIVLDTGVELIEIKSYGKGIQDE